MGQGLRMLCLHGYHGSGAILRRQMSSLAAALPADIELIYADAPSLAQGGFRWWHEGFSGWERTRDWVVDLLRAGPHVDGMFGFSQGAALGHQACRWPRHPGRPRRHGPHR